MMKGIYAVAVLSVATLAAAQTQCPIYRPGDEAKHLPFPGDCTKFYKCDHFQRKVAMDCPLMDTNGNRLHFNARLEVCDWPGSAGCIPGPTRGTTRTTPTTPTTPTPTPTPPVDIYACEDTGGITILIPDRTYCDHFYFCNDFNKNQPSARCQEGDLFDIPTRTCLPERQVNCQGRMTTLATTGTSPSLPPPRKDWTKCPTSWPYRALLPHECQCDKYYECNNNGDKILRNCPRGLHYDYLREACDFPSIVNCVRPIPPFFYVTNPVTTPMADQQL